MHRRGVSFVRRHGVGLLALFVALGGTSYAALRIPTHSVGRSQLKDGAVGNANIRNRAVTFGKLSNGAKGALRSGLVPGVVTQSRLFVPNPARLTTLESETLLLTVPRPDNGAAPWDTRHTVGLASVTYVNTGDPVQLHCSIDGYTAAASVPQNGAGTLTFAGPSTGIATVNLRCKLNSPTPVANPDVRIQNVALMLIPASSVQSS